MRHLSFLCIMSCHVLAAAATDTADVPARLYHKERQLTYYLVGASLTSTALIGAGLYFKNNTLKAVGCGIATGTACSATYGSMHSAIAWPLEFILRIGLCGVILERGDDANQALAVGFGLSTLSSLATYAGYRYYKKTLDKE